MRVTDYHSKGVGHSFSGSIVTIRTDSGETVDAFRVPSWYGRAYLLKHPGGMYGRRFADAVDRARELEEKAQE
jgi:hypothetical protein